jgi:hypothetical protein
LETTSEVEKKWICPNCGSDMKRSSEMYVCPECGCSIEAEEKNFDCGTTCPNCNQPMDGRECSYCGYDLGSDFE